MPIKIIQLSSTNWNSNKHSLHCPVKCKGELESNTYNMIPFC